MRRNIVSKEIKEAKNSFEYRLAQNIKEDPKHSMRINRSRVRLNSPPAVLMDRISRISHCKCLF